MVENNKVLVGEAIWLEIKDQPVNVFGFLGKLSDYVNKIAAVGDALYLRPKAQAVITELDRICGQDALGNRAKTPKYEMAISEDGSLSLRRGVDMFADKSQEVSSPEIVEGSVLMSAPSDK